MTYLLRDIDPAVWPKVKAQAAADGMTVKEVILDLIDAYQAGDITISRTSAASSAPPEQQPQV
jgi:hypothetical protein